MYTDNKVRERVWSRAQLSGVRAPMRSRVMNLGELLPPAQSGGGATLIDFGRDLLATAGSIYFSKKQIDPSKYAPRIQVQVDPGEKAQSMTRNLIIGASVLGVGIVAITMLRK